MTIKSKILGVARRRWRARAGASFVLGTLLALPLAAQAQASFANPESAADALIDAVATSDPTAMTRLLGKDWRTLLPIDEIDVNDRYAFLEKSAKSHAVQVKDGVGALVVGADEWAFPIPIVKDKNGQWHFDPVAGREAMLERAIGRNELAAIQAALAYGDAQREYAQVDRNGNGVLEYAQKMLSSPGKRDGLIWSTSLGDESPLGEAFAPARPGQGYHGYYFKVLTGQGPAAKGGERSYFIGKHMVRGFALVAWPVAYGRTGVMSFIVNQAGKVYQRDLGPQTAQAASAMKVFDPGPAWHEVQP